jgi:predicted outer membrane repeat protein
VANQAFLPYNGIPTVPGIVGQGGGLYFQGGVFAISDSLFMSNRAFERGGAIETANFAGIFVGNNVIQNTQFIDNHVVSYGGGAIYGDDRAINVHGLLTIQDSQFVNNSASVGGAIDAATSPMKIVRDMFVNNTQRYGGALNVNNIWALADGNNPVVEVTVSDSQFVNNISTGGQLSINELNAGATGGILIPIDIANTGGGAIGVLLSGILTVTGTQFTNNSAPSAGAIAVVSAPLWITTSGFLYGAPITLAFQLASGGTLNVMNSQFVNNRATNGDGGAIEAKIWTFAADTATYPGFPNFTATAPVTMTVSGSSFTNNSSTGNGGGIAIVNASAAPVLTDLTATITGNTFYKANEADLLGDQLYSVNATINNVLDNSSGNIFKNLDSGDIYIV